MADLTPDALCSWPGADSIRRDGGDPGAKGTPFEAGERTGRVPKEQLPGAVPFFVKESKLNARQKTCRGQDTSRAEWDAPFSGLEAKLGVAEKSRRRRWPRVTSQAGRVSQRNGEGRSQTLIWVDSRGSPRKQRCFLPLVRYESPRVGAAFKGGPGVGAKVMPAFRQSKAGRRKVVVRMRMRV